MTAVERVLVVGGGIGGTTLASELQLRGIAADIVERESAWGATGTGITLMAPALRAMRMLGILDECLPEGYGVTDAQLFTGDGDFIGRVDMPRLLGPDYPSMGGMMRPTLHRILSTRALDAGVTVRTGTTVTGLHEDDHGVDVELSDGTSDRYDVVVGADGLRSSIRRFLHGPNAPEPTSLGLWVWRALVARPPSVTGLFQYYGAKHKAGFTPLTRDQMYMFLVEPNDSREMPDPEDRPRMIRELLRDFGGTVAEVRETIRSPEQVDVRVLEGMIVDRPLWHSARVILIGDAVHATTPQLAMGGALAMEDGIVLAAELDSAGDVADAFARFLDRRFDRCKLVVDNSVQLAQWEKTAADHEEEAGQLQNESFAALAAPF